MQGGAELTHEVLAVGQTRHRVGVGLLAQRLDLLGLRFEDQLEPRHHRVHRPGQALQLGNVRLRHRDELAIDQRLRLLHRTIERLADARHHRVRHQPGGQADQPERERSTQARLPQVIVSECSVAHHLHRSERAPAVGHLGQARRRFDRHQRDEPLGCAARRERRFA